MPLEARRAWFNRLSDRGLLPGVNNLGQAQFLSHAEAHALIRAHQAQGSLPRTIIMHVDRPTCPNCQRHLPALMRELGVDEIRIYWTNQANPPKILRAAGTN